MDLYIRGMYLMPLMSVDVYFEITCFICVVSYRYSQLRCFDRNVKLI